MEKVTSAAAESDLFLVRLCCSVFFLSLFFSFFSRLCCHWRLKKNRPSFECHRRREKGAREEI